MWTCPKCGAKVNAGFDVCWQCGTGADGTEDLTFVTADQAPPIEEPTGNVVDEAMADAAPNTNASELVPCYQALSLMEAKFLVDQLGEIGIHAVCDEQDMQDNLGGWSGNPRVYCHEADLPRTREFVADYERKKAEHKSLGT